MRVLIILAALMAAGCSSLPSVDTDRICVRSSRIGKVTRVSVVQNCVLLRTEAVNGEVINWQ